MLLYIHKYGDIVTYNLNNIGHHEIAHQLQNGSIKLPKH